MSQLVLSKGNNYHRSIFYRIFKKFEMGPVFLIVSLVIFVALITVITLVFSARQVTKGYVLNSLEAKHQELMRENENRDMQISQVRSLTFIQESSKVQSMVEPRQVVFVNGETTIAKK